jgi:Uma2 family endonuclease
MQKGDAAMVAPALEKPMTAEELLLLPESERYELVKGELVEMSPPPGTEHGTVAYQLGYSLGQHVIPKKLGRLFAAETGFRLARDPDTVRAADVAFVSKDRLPPKMPKGYLDLAPDLVAEVVSPNNDPDEIQAKVREWLEAGARYVLVVYPGPRQVHVYRSLKQVTILTEDDILAFPDLLPELEIAVAAIFA